MNVPHLMLVASMILGFAPANQEPAPLSRAGVTLAELEGTALACNPTLVQAAMRVQAAQAKCVQVGLYPNPVLGYSAEEINNDHKAGMQGAFFGQQIVTAGKLRLSRSVAAQEVAEAQAAWEAQRRRVLNDVRSGYWQVVLAERTVDLNGQLVGIGEESVRASEALYGAQEASRVSVLQARIEAETARLELQNSKNRYLASWRQLAAMVGQPDMAPAPLADGPEGNLPQLAWEECLDRLLSASPELDAARAGVARARCEVARQRAQVTPNVDLMASVHYNNATQDTIAGVQVGMPLPVFDRNQGNICKAEAELVAAEGEVRRIELSLRTRLAAAFERYANAWQQVEAYHGRILPDAQRTLQLVTSGYRQGEFDYLTMLTAQRTYFRVNLSYLESLQALWTGSVAIEGLLLEGGL